MEKVRKYVIYSALYLFFVLSGFIIWMANSGVNGFSLKNISSGNFSEMLAGAVAPLAFFWFIYAVLLQREGLDGQEKEFMSMMGKQSEQIDALIKANKISSVQASVSLENYKNEVYYLREKRFADSYRQYLLYLHRLLLILFSSNVFSEKAKSIGFAIERVDVFVNILDNDRLAFALADFIGNISLSEDEYNVIAKEIDLIHQKKEVFQSVLMYEFGLNRQILENKKRDGDSYVHSVAISQISFDVLGQFIGGVAKFSEYFEDSISSLSRDLELAIENNRAAAAELAQLRQGLERSAK